MIPFITFGSLLMAFLMIVACRCMIEEKEDDDDNDFNDPFFR
jgi:hypothetical protein